MKAPDDQRLQQEYLSLRTTEKFDDEWYVGEYPDVSASGLAPIEHYVRIGRELGRLGRAAVDGGQHNFLPLYSSSHLELSASDLLVSVICITYNHEKFIRQALEGFIRQRTKFAVEFLIGDDCSTDRTAEIISFYAKKDPRIVPVYRKQNVGVFANFADLASRAGGRYVAMCEGDDYWTDPYKLQKQADFLNDHLEYGLVYHPVEVVSDDRAIESFIFPRNPKPSSPVWELIAGNFIQTNSVMYRWRFARGLTANVRPDITPLDWFLHLMHAELGRIGCIDEVMGVYRKHAGGMWANSHLTKHHRRTYGLGELAFYRALGTHFGGILTPVFADTYQGLFDDMVEDALTLGAYDRLIDIMKENIEISRSSFLPLAGLANPELRSDALELENIIKLTQKVSIVVLSHNHAEYIGQCIESLLVQTGPFEIEIIVGDDCSSDNTPSIVSHYAAQDARVQLLRTEVNLGMLANMRRCLDACTGDFIAFCEGDDYWLSEKKLLRQLMFLLRRKDFVMCFNRVLIFLEEEGVFIPHAEQGGLGETLPTPYLASHPVTANFSCCMYRASAAKKVPQSYFETQGAADWLFNILVGGMGKLGFLNEILSVYRVHAKGLWSGLSKHVQAGLFANARRQCSLSIGPARGFDDYQVRYQVADIGGLEFHKYYEGTLDLPRSTNLGFVERDVVELRGWLLNRTGKRPRLRVRYEETTCLSELTERRIDVSALTSSLTGVFCNPICGFNIEVPFKGAQETYFIDVESGECVEPWLKVTVKLWPREYEQI